jgi:hypothetical protein
MRIFFLLALAVATCSAMAQTTKPFHNETDAAEAFGRIEYWNSNQEISDSVNTIDSLYRANELFLTAFMAWLNKDQRTASMSFAKLKERGVTIAESKDKKVRVYSWDTRTGGTMRFYEAVIQYKGTGGYKTVVLADPENTEEGTPGSWFAKVDQLKTAAGKTIYLLTGNSVLATREAGRIMIGVAINGTKLEQNLHLFKTEIGLTDELSIGFTIEDFETDYRATILFNEKTKQLLVPAVSEETWLLTGKKEVYGFNGKYFEKRKK